MAFYTADMPLNETKAILNFVILFVSRISIITRQNSFLKVRKGTYKL